MQEFQVNKAIVNTLTGIEFLISEVFDVDETNLSC